MLFISRLPAEIPILIIIFILATVGPSRHAVSPPPTSKPESGLLVPFLCLTLQEPPGTPTISPQATSVRSSGAVHPPAQPISLVEALKKPCDEIRRSLLEEENKVKITDRERPGKTPGMFLPTFTSTLTHPHQPAI